MNILFSVIKTEPVEINILIKQLESDDPSKVKDSLHKLKSIFKKKIDETKNYNTQNINIQNTDALFSEIIFYIKSQPQDQKRILQNKLALGLSNEPRSTKTFEYFINYINSQNNPY